MRKPRDFDAELKALEDKARDLKSRKVQQLGELVIATGADTLSADELAGALIVLAETKDAGKREAWAKRGAAFFQGRARRTASATDRDAGGAPAQPGGAQPASGGARARHDMRTWQVERRKRTRHLIELGGLVVKAGIVDLTGDDRAIDLRRAALDGRQAQKRSRRTRASALGREGKAGIRRWLDCALAAIFLAKGIR